MARGSFGSPPPRRAIAECDDAFLAETSFPARRAVTNGRLARGGIGLAAVLVVGGLAAGVPGLAHGAGAPTVGVPLTSVEPARAGTTDAFAARNDSVDRNASRDGGEDVRAAAEARASSLASVDEQVVATQTAVALETRKEALNSTTNAIDAESKRLASIKFFWPTAGSISSPWGMRMHPILRYSRLHGGADIGGAVGAPIYAAADGVVTKAATGYNGGSGTNVRIDHGKMDGEALETSYLHMSALDVSVGQKVKKGQRIGAVGSTGLSTSPHLHFSVYVNGVNSDPAPYLKQS